MDLDNANGESNESEADFAKAWQELAKGERTATALENQLSDMEAKIEALLAQAEKEQQDLQRVKEDSSQSSSASASNQQEQSGQNGST